jgi:hypothetical protein
MYLDLDLAWKEHISHLIVESDSKILIDVIMDNYKFSRTIPTLVRHIRNMFALDCHIKICHTWRKDNRCADWLANLVFLLIL